MIQEFALADAAIVVGAGFAAAVVAGLAGFAFGLVATGLWLHVLTPVETAFLIVACGALVQGLSVWQLRGALDLARLWPFVAGGVIGVPLGVGLLAWAAPGAIRAGIGGFLVLYSLYGLSRPALGPVGGGGRLADGGVGMLSGALGGATGLGGILPTIWCGLRGWPKDVQRAVFQPVAVTIHVMTLMWLGGTGTLTARSAALFALAVPAVVAGTWLGLKLYGRLDEAGFRRVVLVLLLASGIVLAV